MKAMIKKAEAKKLSIHFEVTLLTEVEAMDEFILVEAYNYIDGEMQEMLLERTVFKKGAL